MRRGWPSPSIDVDLGAEVLDDDVRVAEHRDLRRRPQEGRREVAVDALREVPARGLCSPRAAACSPRGSSRPSPIPAKWVSVPSTSIRLQRRVGSGPRTRGQHLEAAVQLGRAERVRPSVSRPERQDAHRGQRRGRPRASRARALTRATAVPSPPAARTPRGGGSTRSHASISCADFVRRTLAPGRVRAIWTATRRPPRLAFALTRTARPVPAPARLGAGQLGGFVAARPSKAALDDSAHVVHQVVAPRPCRARCRGAGRSSRGSSRARSRRPSTGRPSRRGRRASRASVTGRMGRPASNAR